SGDDNADTISSVTVNFGAFGGGAAVDATNASGVWTATYTITAGGIDAVNLNVSITATDNAGNATTTADTTDATVDNIAPVLSTIKRRNSTTVTTDATSVTWRVTFDTQVTGVDAADFALVAPTGNTPASTATGTVASVTPVSASV